MTLTISLGLIGVVVATFCAYRKVPIEVIHLLSDVKCISIEMQDFQIAHQTEVADFTDVLVT
ncbi:MAG: hypothetical protein F4X44_03025 [Gammaproteobacteria bacterium]|nr:hypothetical protein [Gammaproteobacteria bacterium]